MHNNLGTVWRDLRRVAEAAEAFRGALSLKPDFVKAHNNLGHALFDLGELDEAIAAFCRALELATCINLAGLSERANRVDITRKAIDRGLAIPAHDASLHLLAAKCEWCEGDFEAAVGRLEKVTGADERIAIEIAFELGQLHERLDAPERAMTAFTKGNRLASELPAHRAIDKNEFLGLIHAIDTASTPEWIEGWTSAPPAEDPPIFLLGFPRSGTTLTEQILAAHLALATIDEKPTLDAMLAEVPGYPAGMAGLGEAQVAALRGVYANAVAPFAAPGARIVDKMPLNIIHAAAMHRFFPGAKLV
ncbi:MAG: hypothetical protein CMM31_09080, partial [Rhodospirillaceae bacterium]|nr:hypothetical protein [Rhodospirillaceae bacterium]